MLLAGEMERTELNDVGDEGMRFKLWMFGKVDGVMVKELREKVVEVRRVSDRMMAVVLASEENELRLTCEYFPQSWRLEENIF